MKMASENSSVSASPSLRGKRSRDPEEQVYLDNLHSHKRYLSEIMASSLNGLTVGDPLPDNLMDSPARSDNLFYLRDDMSIQYSPLSEDSDDSRYCDTMSPNTFSSQSESLQTSPVSSYRYHQRGLSGFSYAPSSTTAYNSSSSPHISSLPNVTSTQPRHRNSDSEGRFPSSPSDICHSADLRRAALLRSVQMKTHPVGPPSSFELPFTAGQESVHTIEENEEEEEERPCSFLKSLIDGRRRRRIEDCSSCSSILEVRESGTAVNMKVDESMHDIETEEEEEPCSFMNSQVDERD